MARMMDDKRTRPAWKRRLDRIALWLAHHLWIVRWHAPKHEEDGSPSRDDTTRDSGGEPKADKAKR